MTRERTAIALVLAGSAVAAVALVSLGPPRPPPAPPVGAPSARAVPADDESGPPRPTVVAAPPTPASSSAAAPPPAALPISGCPEGMVAVRGVSCPFVAHRCVERGARDACRRYADEALCDGRLTELRFCVDRLEYPNVPGALPVTQVTFDEARAACGVEGKRLCTAAEWAFACEGSTLLPYATGAAADAALCALDVPPTSARGPLAGARPRGLDVRSPVGSHPRCESPSGALDLTGNVAEWVDNEHGAELEAPFRWAAAGGSALRGVDASCRALDARLAIDARSVGLGFRCCADGEGGGAAARRVLEPRSRLRKVQVGTPVR
jgi:sulfatase modifying factor 1